MTPPALVVFIAALVYSVSGTGTVFKQVADHGDTYDIKNPMSHIKFIYRNELKMDNSKTNVHNNNLDVKLNSSNITNYKINLNDTHKAYNYKDDHPIKANLEIHRKNIEILYKKRKEYMRQYNFKDDQGKLETGRRRIKREEDDPRCEFFKYKGANQISHPREINGKSNLYANHSNCVSHINGTEGVVVQLTFVDVFHIEDHPECAYDYLEIRDGNAGYARLLDKVCGENFPHQITSSGPNLWLKFYSDDTIEYEGFTINIDFIQSTKSHNIPLSCYKYVKGRHGVIDTSAIDQDCLDKSADQALEVLWTIETPPGTKIYLNFTSYSPAKPNECEENVVQVFGSLLEFDAKLAHFCGLIANSVTTKGEEAKGSSDKGNEMHIRLYASKAAKSTNFNATFTAFRTLNLNIDEKCKNTEFDCQDNTCIASKLKCDGYAHCRLKIDEDYEICKVEAASAISEPHIMVILVIFSLILSGMSFVFLFKCIRKLYQDQKLIKEHIRQSCEDRLDSLVGSRLTLDPKRLTMDNEPRASLERENHTNEMFKQQRNLSRHKHSSIDSDFIQETHLDLEDEPWRRDVDGTAAETEDVRIERNHRSRRSDTSKKEESIRSKSTKESDRKKEEKREIRDVSVGAPDTKEEGCQTRESLFQAGAPVPSSEGTESGTNSRRFSTFGHSGATLTRPSPPAHTNMSEVTIELIRQESQDKPQKKIDRRPMSTETTRSAPDVIIVSKPIR